MALTSASTRTEVIAQYRDNAAYDVNGSLAECRLFIEACRHWLILTADEVTHGGESIRDEAKKIQDELARAIAWLEASGGASTLFGRGRVKHFDFSDFRT